MRRKYKTSIGYTGLYSKCILYCVDVYTVGCQRVPASRCRMLVMYTHEHTCTHTHTSGNVSQSAVAEHAMDESHTIKWEEAEVVNHHPLYRQRCALEAWHIRTERHKMNRDEGPLPPVYNPLVHLSRLHPPH